jgi:predicted SAM-dependent methyltransferase
MSIQGFVDRIENGRLKGWAYDSMRPNQPVKLTLFHKDTLILDFFADELREDLKSINAQLSNHAFDLKIPHKILNLDESQLRVKISSSEDYLPILSPLIDIRKQLSAVFLKGSGLEIGALHNPLWVSPGVSVKYVDRANEHELQSHYPEQDNITKPDIIDDGETLITLPNARQDFIIANHVLEHCENPIKTIRRHLEVIKVKGILFYTIPDMRFFLDKDRLPTTFQHTMRDFTLGPDVSRKEHYTDWAKFWRFKHDPKDISDEADRLNKANYSIHFHVWNYNSFFNFLISLQEFFKFSFSIEVYAFNFTEIICILRKHY